MTGPDPAVKESQDLEPTFPAEDGGVPADGGASGVVRPEPATASPAPGGRRSRPRISGIQLALVIVAVMAGGALFLSGYSLGRQVETTPGTPGTERAAFVPFWDAYRAITEQYAGGSVDRKTVVEGAIRGMIESLGDPFSSYLSSEDYRKSLQGIAGQFEGIGAEIGGRKTDGSGAQCTPLGADCRMVVLSPVAGAPAEKAGVLAGDVITAIDGTTVDGLSVDEAVAKIRGPHDTTVVLTIIRGSAPPITISIVRAVIAQKEVIGRSLAGGQVGYIRITGFSDNAASVFASTLADDVKSGQRKFVLDLRGNPGGFVTAARTVASQFIGSGPIYWQEDAHGNQVASLAEPGGAATDAGIRVVVLIDKGSASASEIVAGALQDTKRGVLVGQTSYGKGTIQEWQPLPDDTGGFRLTIAKWLTPDKRWIHHVGLTPDVAVDVPQNTPVDQDPVLDKAVEVLSGATAGVLDLAA
jgi:carboxyl-terminal processing protease